jgi:DNA-binding CsgD family transcriptional regulator
MWTRVSFKFPLGLAAVVTAWTEDQDATTISVARCVGVSRQRVHQLLMRANAWANALGGPWPYQARARPPRLKRIRQPVPVPPPHRPAGRRGPDGLTPRERQVWHTCLAYPTRSHRELAAMLSVTPAYVWQVVRRVKATYVPARP